MLYNSTTYNIRLQINLVVRRFKISCKQFKFRAHIRRISKKYLFVNLIILLSRRSDNNTSKSPGSSFLLQYLPRTFYDGSWHVHLRLWLLNRSVICLGYQVRLPLHTEMLCLSKSACLPAFPKMGTPQHIMGTYQARRAVLILKSSLIFLHV